MPDHETVKRVRTPIGDLIHDAAVSVDLDPETVTAEATGIEDGELVLELRGERP